MSPRLREEWRQIYNYLSSSITPAAQPNKVENNTANEEEIIIIRAKNDKVTTTKITKSF